MQVTLLLGDGFQRLLAHGIAQFHGLRSASRLAWPGETIVSLTGPDSTYSPAAGPAAADSNARVFVVRQLRSQEVGLIMLLPAFSCALLFRYKTCSPVTYIVRRSLSRPWLLIDPGLWHDAGNTGCAAG